MNTDEARKISEQSTRTLQENSLQQVFKEKEERLKRYKDKALEVIQQLSVLLEDGVAAQAHLGKRELTVYWIDEEFIGSKPIYETVKKGWFVTGQSIKSGYSSSIPPDFAEAIAIECRRLGYEAVWTSTSSGGGDNGRGFYFTGLSLLVRW